MNTYITIAMTILSISMSCANCRAGDKFSLTLSKSPLWKDSRSYDAVYLPDGNSVLIKGWLWDCRTEKLIRRLNKFNPGQERFALSPCGKTLALNDQGYHGEKNEVQWAGVTLVDVATGKKIYTFKNADASPLGGKISFSSDGSRIFVISYDMFFTLSIAKRKIESTGTLGPTKSLLPEEGIVAEIIPYESSPANVVFTDKVNPKFRIQLSSFEEGQNTKRLLSIEKGRVERVAFTSDGKYVYARIMAGIRKEDKPRCVFWSIKTGRQIKTVSALDGKSYVVMSGRVFNEKYLIMVDEKHERNAILDLSSGKLIPLRVDKTGQCLIIGIAPNGEDCAVKRYAPSESPSTSIWLGILKKENSQQKTSRDTETPRP